MSIMPRPCGRSSLLNLICTCPLTYLRVPLKCAGDLYCSLGASFLNKQRDYVQGNKPLGFKQ